VSKDGRKRKSLKDLEDRFIQTVKPIDAAEGDAPKQETKQAENSGYEILVANGGMQASLRTWGKVQLTDNDIQKALLDKNITHGIDRAALLVAADRIGKDGGLDREMIVARAILAEHSYEIVYPFLEQVGELGSEKSVWLVDGVPLVSDLQILFDAERREEWNAIENVVVKAVRPGEVIVREVSKKGAAPGKNIFGEEIDEAPFPLTFGKNIQWQESTGEYCSTIFGYLHFAGNVLEVMEPLWIDPHKMNAYFVNLPQVGEWVAPDYSMISSLLLHLHIKPKLISNNNIEAIVAKMATKEKLPVTITIAKGIRPELGKDARIAWHADTKVRAGTLREDRTIDLRERNIVTAVAQGGLVAEKIKATKGKSGTNLFGEEIEATDGRDVPFKSGKGIVVDDKEDRVRYFAAHNGNVSMRQGVLSVAKVFNISGDVDYATGNVHVKTDLLIGGTVKTGFTVRAEGNVQINGMVEGGATVEAQGNIIVKNGILGLETTVVSYGDVKAQFIQDAEVFAHGNVIISSYIYNSTVRAAGTIVVKQGGGGKGGKVIGGMLVASGGMEMSIVGSPTNRSTVLALQASIDQRKKIDKISEEYNEKKGIILKIMRTLELDSVDPLAIRAKLEQAAPAKKELVTKLLINLSSLIKQKNILEKEKKEIEDAVKEALGKATIRISREFYQGNTVQIGTKKYEAPTDLGPATFQLQDGVIRI